MTPPVVVLKVGGDVVADADRLAHVVSDINVVLQAGTAVVVVHGGGPQATELTRRLGLHPNVVAGRRITSPEVLQVMKMTLAGEVNVDLAAACRAAGVPGLGISGVSSGLVRARRRPPRVVSGCGDEPMDFGEVGDVISVDKAGIMALIEAGFVPLISSLSADDAGRVLNINADIVASYIAVGLGAQALVLLTGADGVLGDIDDPTTRYPELSVGQAQTLISNGTVYGGMIPKLEESFRVIQAGVGRVIILAVDGGGRVAGALNGSTAGGTTLHA